MSLETGRYKLFNAMKTLQVHWDETSMSWQDGVRRDFVKLFWHGIEPRVIGTMAAMDRLGHAISQLKHECGDESS